MKIAVVVLCLALVAPAIPAGEDVPMRRHEHERGPQLLGEVTRADIASELPGWDEEYAAYAPGASALSSLAAVDEPVDIVCVLGTWCHDSEREVPRFWKILDAADNAALALTMFAVGRTSDAAADSVLAELGFVESPRTIWAAEYVPTFVFLRGGREIGRIVESPLATLEEDAAALLAETPTAPTAPAWR